MIKKVFKYFLRFDQYKVKNHQRLDRKERVGLPKSMIEDLELKPGDFLLFAQSDEGRWQVWTDEEMSEMIKIAWENK